MDTEALTDELKSQARSLGFSLAGVCPAVAAPGQARFDEWLSAGYAGQMHYLADRRDAYEHPKSVLDGARSILMLAMDYKTEEPAPLPKGSGRIARYAWGSLDYHDLIRKRLNQLATRLRELEPQCVARGVVDTAPLMEREFAQLAGLGWIGKNTLLLNKQRGSWFFLAALLTDLELEYDQPQAVDHCGTCRACLDACPTNAFVEPYVLDASRCISYLTIELKDAMPVELRNGVGGWLFGCDVCQEVCPWNQNAPASEQQDFQPLSGHNPTDLLSLFDLDDDAFRRMFRHTPMWRPRRRGLLRNAAIVLGNQATELAIPALEKGLTDEEPLVRGACAWALGEIGSAGSKNALEQRLAIEANAKVREEIELALGD